MTVNNNSEEIISSEEFSAFIPFVNNTLSSSESNILVEDDKITQSPRNTSPFFNDEEDKLKEGFFREQDDPFLSEVADSNDLLYKNSTEVYDKLYEDSLMVKGNKVIENNNPVRRRIDFSNCSVSTAIVGNSGEREFGKNEIFSKPNNNNTFYHKNNYNNGGYYKSNYNKNNRNNNSNNYGYNNHKNYNSNFNSKNNNRYYNNRNIFTSNNQHKVFHKATSHNLSNKGVEENNTNQSDQFTQQTNCYQKSNEQCDVIFESMSHHDEQNEVALRETITLLPSELILTILEFLEFKEIIQFLFLCKNMCNKIIDEDAFYKVLFCRYITNDIETIQRYIKKKKKYNSDIKQGVIFHNIDYKFDKFTAKDLGQWQRTLKKKEKELELKQRKHNINWKRTFEGYFIRSISEKIIYEVSLFKGLIKRTKAYKNAKYMLFHGYQFVIKCLNKLDPKSRERIICRNYGKHIKRNHTLLHEFLYRYSLCPDRLAKVQEEVDLQVYPIVHYLNENSSVKGGLERVLFKENDWGFSGFHYIIKVRSFNLLSLIINEYYGYLKASSIFEIKTKQRKYFLFDLLKAGYPFIKIKRDFFSTSLIKIDFLVQVNEMNENIIHQAVKLFIHNTSKITEQNIFHLLKFIKVNLRENLPNLLSMKENISGLTPCGIILNECECRLNENRLSYELISHLYGMFNFLTVTLGYEPTKEELEKWNRCLKLNNESSISSSAVIAASRFSLSPSKLKVLRESHSHLAVSELLSLEKYYVL
ncbi:hypothetical protein ABK040_004811 [Willaertia magna]